MAKIKIGVPKEFQVFLDKAVDIIDGYNRDEKTMGNILEDMAKFRYYLRGRMEELVEISKIEKLSSKILEEVVEKLDALRKLNNQITVVFNALISNEDG